MGNQGGEGEDKQVEGAPGNDAGGRNQHEGPCPSEVQPTTPW